MRCLADLDLRGKRVLIRVDFNVPIRDGAIASDLRIRRAVPTIQAVLKGGAGVILASHLGRPNEGIRDPALSLRPAGERLMELVDLPVRFVSDWHRGVRVIPGEFVLLENIRFEAGETANSPDLAQRIGNLCDVFVMDAFATAHRAHASTVGVVDFTRKSCAGLLMEEEVAALDAAMAHPRQPMVAVIGGAKVSTKLKVLDALGRIADRIILVGGMANTLLLARGMSIGRSLSEPDMVDAVQRLARETSLFALKDVVVAREERPDAPGVLRMPTQVESEESILDIGPVSAREIASMLQEAGTIIWNGPMGMFELDQFGEGTRVVGEAIAESGAFSVAGGGETVAAIEKYGLASGIDYISTAGGAFLEYLECGSLPGIEALK